LVEFGLQGAFIQRLGLGQPPEFMNWILPEKPNAIDDLLKKVSIYFEENPCEAIFGIALLIEDKAIAYFVYKDKFKEINSTRMYGGPLAYAQQWAINTGLDYLRRSLAAINGDGKTGE
jgi:hypothetical protein